MRAGGGKLTAAGVVAEKFTHGVAVRAFGLKLSAPDAESACEYGWNDGLGHLTVKMVQNRPKTFLFFNDVRMSFWSPPQKT